MLSRRELFVLHAAAAAVLLVPAPLRAAPPAFETFSEADRELLAALGRATYGEGADALDVPGAVQALMAWLPEDKQRLVVQLPGLFNQLTRVFLPSVSSWAALSPEDQRRALEDWETSTLTFRRQVTQALRQLVLVSCYVNPDVFPSISYGGPWLGRVEVPVHLPRFGEAS